MLLGVLFSGAIVRKLKPGAGLVSAHILVVDVLLVVCFAASLFLGCDTLRVSGVQEHNGEYVLDLLQAIKSTSSTPGTK